MSKDQREAFAERAGKITGMVIGLLVACLLAYPMVRYLLGLR